MILKPTRLWLWWVFFGLMVYLSYWLKNRWRLNTGEDFGGLAGDVVPGSNGCRKVRWTRQGMGKRGGARVIYFNEIEDRIWLLIVYSKAKLDNLPAEFLAQLQREVENG